VVSWAKQRRAESSASSSHPGTSNSPCRFRIANPGGIPAQGTLCPGQLDCSSKYLDIGRAGRRRPGGPEPISTMHMPMQPSLPGWSPKAAVGAIGRLHKPVGARPRLGNRRGQRPAPHLV
jgi:hypothetical protein